MKQLFSWIFFLVMTTSAIAQQSFYAIFQSKEKAPFFVKYKAKIYSSSASGFLILPKLTNGEQVVKIGLPKSSNGENTFSFTVANADVSFLMQVENNTVASIQESKSAVVIYAKGTNTSVVTPSVATNIPPNEPKPITTPTINIEPNNPVAKQNETIANTVPIIDTTKSVDTNAQVPLSKPIYTEPEAVKTDLQSIVRKINDTTKSNSGFLTTKYVVNYNGQLDTIIVEYPAASILPNKLDEEIEKVAPPNPADGKVNNKSSETKAEVIEENNKPNSTTNTENNKNTPVLINTDCSKIASNSDYISLRKKMAGYAEAVKLNEVALKAFKKKCHLTEQVKGLAGLYASDLERVNFFLIVYPYVVDSSNFKMLVNELKSEQAISLFKEKVFK